MEALLLLAIESNTHRSPVRRGCHRCADGMQTIFTHFHLYRRPPPHNTRTHIELDSESNWNNFIDVVLFDVFVARNTNQICRKPLVCSFLECERDDLNFKGYSRTESFTFTWKSGFILLLRTFLPVLLCLSSRFLCSSLLVETHSYECFFSLPVCMCITIARFVHISYKMWYNSYNFSR